MSNYNIIIHFLTIYSVIYYYSIKKCEKLDFLPYSLLTQLILITHSLLTHYSLITHSLLTYYSFLKIT
jgi:hypothetical protein